MSKNPFEDEYNPFEGDLKTEFQFKFDPIKEMRFGPPNILRLTLTIYTLFSLFAGLALGEEVVKNNKGTTCAIETRAGYLVPLVIGTCYLTEWLFTPFEADKNDY